MMSDKYLIGIPLKTLSEATLSVILQEYSNNAFIYIFFFLPILNNKENENKTNCVCMCV